MGMIIKKQNKESVLERLKNPPKRTADYQQQKMIRGKDRGRDNPLYESQGIEISLSNSEIDTVFWNAAAPGTPTEGIKDFLDYLKNKGIRTGVISNISYNPSVVAERINRLLPDNTFEFIITSSNFLFRKPNKRIFDLALEKAQLRPDEVWYIGDQYECDVKGSLNAGMFPIWYIGALDLPYTVEEVHSLDKNILTVTDWNELRQRMEG